MMVVAFHALSIQAKYLSGVILLPELLRIGQTGVDFFFAISGFVMVLVTKRENYTITGVYTFLRGRFLRIYPTYWVYYFILLLVYFAIPGIINQSQGGNINLVNSFFLMPSDTLPLLMVAWTLTHELWFYIVFAILLFLPSQPRMLAILGWLVFIVFAWQYDLLKNSPTERIISHLYSIEFVLGALSAFTYLKIKSFEKPLALIIIGLSSLALVIAWAVIEWPTQAGMDLHVTLLRVILLGGGYSAMLLALALAENTGWVSVNKLARLLGDASFSIYLSHIIVLSICGRAFQLYTHGYPPQPLEALIFWVITFSCVVICGYISYRLIESPILSFASQKRDRKP